MIQSCQIHQDHIDTHYTSALFRYEKEFALKYKSYVDFICMDDKHEYKVGEPGFHAAAVEKERL